MNKKVISSILAGAMALSMAGMNVFAADEAVTTGSDKVYGKSYDVPATVEPVTLQVTVPGTIDAILNPYGLKISSQSNVTDLVASPAYKIVNNGETNVAVSVTGSVNVTETTNKNVKFLTAMPTKDTTTKDIFLYVKMAKTDTAAAAAAEKTDLVLSTKDTTKANYYVVAKKEGSTAGEAYVKVNGFVNGKADSQWTDDDAVTIKLAFKFEATGKDASTT